MKLVILAGGKGTRFAEETALRPKPMIAIGGRPIIWHIMKYYSTFGFREFVICLGYQGEVIKEYFANYDLYSSDVTFSLKDGRMQRHRSQAEDWQVSLIDTGAETMTGGRLKRCAPYLGDEPFCLTYGDGVSDVDIAASIEFHQASGRKATVTAVRPVSRFGQLALDGDRVTAFEEKPEHGNVRINGGFFVLDRSVLDYIAGDDTIWEREPLERLAADGELGAYLHDGFWHSMDTLRDQQQLEAIWNAGAPWKRWQ